MTNTGKTMPSESLAGSTWGYRRAKMPHTVASLQGEQSDDREDRAIRREFGLPRPHLLRPDEDPRRRRAIVRRDRGEGPGRDPRLPRPAGRAAPDRQYFGRLQARPVRGCRALSDA